MRTRRSRSLTDLVVDALEMLGVRVVFGLPGTENIGLYDSLRRSKIRSVLTTSETTAGFMAIGWYRATGQPGVFAAIEGPGFSWAVPPLAEAGLDASAVLLVTGKPADDAQKYDLGSLRQGRIASELGAAVFDIDDPASARDVVREAWTEATKFGPKPVVLQVAHRGGRAEPLPQRHSAEIQPDDAIDQDMLAEAVSAVEQAERPVVFAGSGCLAYGDDLRQLIESAGMPCLTTPTARGVLPESHPMSIMSDLLFADVETLNTFLDRSDLILALGCRFARNSTAGFRLRLTERKLVHVSATKDTPHPIYPCRLSVRSDIGEFLRAAVAVAKKSRRSVGASWDQGEIAAWRTSLRERMHILPAQPRWQGHGDCAALFRQIREGIPKDGIVVTDTGLHQLLTRAHFEALCPRALIFPSDFQSMGFGLPAAIGAALATRTRPVAAILGDGGLLMIGAELLTAKREQIGLPAIVFCDNRLGLIRSQQMRKFGYEASTRLESAALADYAKWLGIEYSFANEYLAEHIRTAFDRSGPTLIEVPLEENPGMQKLGRSARLKSSVESVFGTKAAQVLNRLDK